MTFYVYFEMTYEKVVKSQQEKFSPQSVKMSLLNVYRNFGFEVPGCYGDL